MSLTTSLFTGLTGLDVHSKNMDVIGNNVTNANTIGFKSSRALFESQLSTTLSSGTAPRTESGGTNPSQVGLGVKFGGTHRDHTNGSIQPTGVNTDLALEGQGFFVLSENGQTRYSRNGQFDLDADNQLVSTTGGGVVRGYGVDDDFNLIPGELRDLSIPLGSMTVAEATRNVDFAGNLNASGAMADAGSRTHSQNMTDLSTGVAATAGTPLSQLSSDGITPLFAEGNTTTAGDVITLRGAEKGGKAIQPFTFEVNADNVSGSDGNGTTFGDFAAFLEDVLGINTSVDGAGVGIDTNGAIEIAGNFGEINDINLQTADLTSDGSAGQPFIFEKDQDATGESIRTSFIAYDSLGTPLTADLSMVLTNKDSGGTTWRFYAESPDDTDLSTALGTGTLSFDTLGELTDPPATNLQIDRTGTGAIDPLTVTLNFADEEGGLTALTNDASEMAAVFQDGSPIGSLDSFSIGEDGTITGAFTNGLSRTIGQVALATFANPEGLVDAGSNLYASGPNSGLAVEVAPGTFGAGRIVSGALELSNVDLSKEFVNLISTSTGFSASSRVITTSDELIQQLLATAR